LKIRQFLCFLGFKEISSDRGTFSEKRGLVGKKPEKRRYIRRHYRGIVLIAIRIQVEVESLRRIARPNGPQKLELKLSKI